MDLLSGRRAVVTGAGSGIGRATCLRMADEGASVAVVDVDADAAARVGSEVGGPWFAVDVRDAEALTSALADAAAAMDGFDTLFNNAGTGNVMPLHRYPDDEWERLLAVNVRGTFNGIRAAVPLLSERAGGCIVNMASVSGIRPTRGEGPYSAAKAAVIALTKSAALEYAPAIRVNCVSPGFIDTPLTAFAVGDERQRAPIEAATPLGRVGRAEEVANAVVFLCSDLASYTTGHNLVVDGGSMLTNSQVDPLLRGLLSAYDTPGGPDDRA